MNYSIRNEGKKKLTISDRNITQLPEIKDIKILVCRYCPLLTSIPIIPGLEELYCGYCISLTSIPNIKGLKVLVCYDCTSLISISNIKGLKEINCEGCTSLTYIPTIKGLESLFCKDCTLLTYMPYIASLKLMDNSGCPWIKPDQERKNKLIKLQKWWKIYLLRNKLNKFLPPFQEFWFSPDGPGYRAAIRRLYESCKKQ
tara:strand:- start:776 stop:1375 length:600 start_codon:yes stop_codon:yes gene_type:complete